MKNSIATVLVSLCAFYLNAQIPLPPNDDEDQVPDYQLGDPLVFENGTVLKGPEDWPLRRTELLGLFEEHMYGKAPGKPKNSYYEEQRTDSTALDGTAIRKEVRLIFPPLTAFTKPICSSFYPKMPKDRYLWYWGSIFMGTTPSIPIRTSLCPQGG